MSVIQSDNEVLTLAEAAAYLRVPEDALLTLAAEDSIPAQKINDEWRFLKSALADWLRYGRHFYQEIRRIPLPWMLDLHQIEELMDVLEKRLLSKLEPCGEKVPKPGTKQAVERHFGIWQDDPVAETLLEDIYKRRRGKAGSDE